MALSALGKLGLLALATAARDRQPLGRWEGWQRARQCCHCCVLLKEPLGKGLLNARSWALCAQQLREAQQGRQRQQRRKMPGLSLGGARLSILNGCEWAASTAKAFPCGLPVKKSVLRM